jgi:hypothetical protein
MTSVPLSYDSLTAAADFIKLNVQKVGRPAHHRLGAQADQASEIGSWWD